MRLGQHLRVRKFGNGGPVAEGRACTEAGGYYNVDTMSCQGPHGGVINTTESLTPPGNTSNNPNPSNPSNTTYTGPTYSESDIEGLTDVESQTGSDFGHLAGLAQNPEQLAAYLKAEYGLQDAGDYTESFEEYNPYEEQQMKKSYQFGMGEAQTGARQQMGDVFAKARAAGAKGGGFGGAGRSLAAMKGKTLGGLESQQKKLGTSYTSGVQGLREDYSGDWLDMVSKLGSMDAVFCKPPKVWDDEKKTCE